MLPKAFCATCQAYTPHRTLYIRSWVGAARTWKEVFLACTQCKEPYHIKRATYKAAKYTGEERFDQILRQAASPIDAGLLRRRLDETGQHYTETALLDSLAYLNQNGYITIEEKDHTDEVLQQVEVTKNFALCNSCGKKSAVTLYSMRNRKFVSVGTICIACKSVALALPEEG